MQISNVGMVSVKRVRYLQCLMYILMNPIHITPRENMTWRLIIILSLHLPITNSLMNVQWRVMAEFIPIPPRKRPIDTQYMLKEQQSITSPTQAEPHDSISAFLLPQLSAMCEKRMYPRREPQYVKDWTVDTIQDLLQMQNQNAYERVSGMYSRWSLQNIGSGLEHTYFQQDSLPLSPSWQTKSVVRKRKLREKKKEAAMNHLSPKDKNIRNWYLPSPPTLWISF